MAYSTLNPPALAEQNIGNTGLAFWHYISTDAAAAVDTSGYISNAAALGMKAGDSVGVLQIGVTPPVRTTHLVRAINANGSADLNDGAAATTTNTD